MVDGVPEDDLQAKPHAVVLTVGYDGRPYAGFVEQRGQRTVAGELLKAIRRIDDKVDMLRVASRTDAGVHARAQCLAFDTAQRVPPRGWVLGLTQRLPDSIAIRSAALAPEGFNPRFVTKRKRYRYLLLCEHLRDPFLAERVWRVEGLADDEPLSRLRQEWQQAVGSHDFSAFASARDKRMHTERTLSDMEATLLQRQPQLVALDVTGDGFLHNMVRILVGTAVDVARGRLAPGAMRRAIASGERTDAGMTAPPGGLYLEEVELDCGLTEVWPPNA